MSWRWSNHPSHPLLPPHWGKLIKRANMEPRHARRNVGSLVTKFNAYLTFEVQAMFSLMLSVWLYGKEYPFTKICPFLPPYKITSALVNHHSSPRALMEISPRLGYFMSRILQAHLVVNTEAITAGSWHQQWSWAPRHWHSVLPTPNTHPNWSRLLGWQCGMLHHYDLWHLIWALIWVPAPHWQSLGLCHPCGKPMEFQGPGFHQANLRLLWIFVPWCKHLSLPWLFNYFFNAKFL